MPKNIKNLIIVGGIVVIVIIVLAFTFGRKTSQNGEPTFLQKLFPTSETTTQPSSTASSLQKGVSENTSNTQEAGSINPQDLKIGSLIRLSADAVSSVGVFGTSTRYHKNIAETLGHLFERKSDGSDEEKRISNFTIPQILKVVWSKDGKKSVIFYALEKEIRKILVDYSENTPKTNFLPDTVSAIVFSPDSKSVAFINSLNGSENVFTANLSFGNQKKIFDNNIPDFELSWPVNNFLALKTKSSYVGRGFLYKLNTSGGSLEKIIDTSGLDAIWNSDGSGLLYTNSNLDVFFLDLKNGKSKNLGFKTVAEKCVFSKNKITLVFCAIPQSIPAGNYPDDWWQGKISFYDNIALLDVETLNLAIYAQSFSDVINPVLSTDDSYLVFKDRNTGELWSLKLK